MRSLQLLVFGKCLDLFATSGCMERDFPTQAKDKTFGNGAHVAGVAQPPRDSGKLPTSGCRKGNQIQHRATSAGSGPPYTRSHPIAPERALPGLLLSVLAAARTCAGCANAASLSGSKHSWHARALAVPRVLLQACRRESKLIWFPGQPLGHP